jgi:hypothetical protein
MTKVANKGSLVGLVCMKYAVYMKENQTTGRNILLFVKGNEVFPLKSEMSEL